MTTSSLLVALGLSLPLTAAAQARLEAPAEASGDGVSPIVARFIVEPPTEARPRITLSAGSVRRLQSVGPGRWEIDLLPPRIAAPLRWTIRAALPSGPAAGAEVRLAALPLSSEEARSGGPFDLRGPSRALAGAGPIELSVRGDGAAPLLLASSGTVEQPRIAAAAGEGKRRLVRYTPPAQRRPGVVLLVAQSADGSVVDRLVLPLYGQPTATVTTQAEATVTVTLDGQTYGPLLADHAGRVAVPIYVSPAGGAAVVAAVDPLGNLRESPLPLEVPRAPVALLACASTDGGGGVVRTWAVDSAGRPATHPPRVIDAAGAPLALTATSEGAWEARIPVGGVSFRLPDSAAACRIVRRPATPLALAVALDRPSWSAGDPPLRVIATLRYSDGQRRSTEVKFEPDLGAIDAPTPTTDGSEADWRLPDELAGRATATVTARVDALTARAQIALRPGPPSRIAFAGAPAALRADGHSRATIAARAFDRFGNPVAAAIDLATTDGRLTAAPLRDGARASLVAPVRYAPGVETITATAGMLRARLDLPLRPARFDLTARVGFRTNFGRVAAGLVALDGRLHLPTWGGRIALALTAELYGSRSSAGVAGGGEAVEVDLLAIPLLAQLIVRQPIGPLTLYGGGGGGALFAAITVASPSAGSVDGWTTRPAGSLLVGGSGRLGPGHALLEASFLYANLPSTRLGGNLGGLGVSAGYRIDL